MQFMAFKCISEIKPGPFHYLKLKKKKLSHFIPLLFSLKKKMSLYFFDSFHSQLQAAEIFQWDFAFMCSRLSDLINSKSYLEKPTRENALQQLPQLWHTELCTVSEQPLI